MGRGTTGIVSAFLRRNFTGIDLYSENVAKAEKNISNTVKGKINLKLGEQIVDLSTEKIPSLELYLNSSY
jgi:DNA modification methylase